MIFLSAHHIYRQVTDYGGWNMDISTALMMNTCKFTAFAWCYHDGGKKPEQLSEDQRKRRIERLPNFLE